MRLVAWLAVCAALWMPVASHAAEKIERKYVENSKQVQQTEQKTEQTLTIAGMPLETKVSATQVADVVVGKRDDAGKLPIDEKIRSLQTSMSLPGGLSLDFDSADPDKKAENELLEPVLDIFRAILKNPIHVVVDREDRVAEAKLADNAQDNLPKEIKTVLSPERLKRNHEQDWMFLPDKAVNVGDEWERFIDKDLGGGQTMNFKIKYSYAGAENKDGKTLHKFNLAYQEVTYAMDPNANPMVQVSKSDLKIPKASGTILYDPATGEIPLRESEVKITGTLTLVVNGQELPSDLDLTLTEKATLQK
jgi:hypothetical protein